MSACATAVIIFFTAKAVCSGAVRCLRAKQNNKALSRRTSTFEYQSVVDEVIKQGFDGYFQQRSSASEEFIPEFFDSKYY